MSTIDRRNISLVGEMAWVAKGILDLTGWGFKESARLTELSNTQTSAVIYDSEWCRMKIAFLEWHPPFQTTYYAIHVYYGRCMR